MQMQAGRSTTMPSHFSATPSKEVQKLLTALKILPLRNRCVSWRASKIILYPLNLTVLLWLGPRHIGSRNVRITACAVLTSSVCVDCVQKHARPQTHVVIKRFTNVSPVFHHGILRPSPRPQPTLMHCIQYSFHDARATQCIHSTMQA